MTTEAGVAYVSVKYDPRSLAALEATTAKQGRAVEGMWGTAARRAGKALAIGLGVGTIAAGIGLYKAVNAARSFQQELNVMEAVSGATGDQMARIQRLAIALGKDIRLPATSASDAAVAMTELAKGGLSVTDSMRAARGTLQLAAAGEIAVKDAAAISANALNAFGLAGTQAGHVADLLAGAANASTGEVSDFAEGLQYAASASHAAGQNIDLVIAALAEMANKGLQGSVAGSSLAQSLRSLQAPTSKAQAALDKFGISVYDAQGNMEPLDVIAQTFTDHLGNLSQKQQNATLATIFGSRAVQAARIVFLGGRDALDQYRDKVSRSGNAQRLAAARTKGFSGALQALSSNAETLGITIGLKLLPVLTTATRKLSGFIDFLSRLADAPNVSVAVHIALEGIRDIGVSIREAIMGHGVRIKAIKIPAGKVIGFEREPASGGLAASLAAAISGVDWGPVGLAIGAGIGASIQLTADTANRIAQFFIDNSDVFAKAGATIAAKMVAELLDPAFWAAHWKTTLAIALTFIPVGKLATVGKTMGRLLTRPIGRLFLAVFEHAPSAVKDFVIAAEILIRGGFRRAARSIIRSLSGAAEAVPNRFQVAFAAVWRIASGVARDIAGFIRGRISAAVAAVGNRIQKSVIARMVTWLAKLGVIQMVLNVIAGIFDRIKSAVQWLIDHVPDIHFPSVPSIFGKIKGAVTATGGIAVGAQARIVGEAGPEAILPLEQLHRWLPQVSAPRGDMVVRGRMAITNWRDGMAEIDLRITDHADLVGAR